MTIRAAAAGEPTSPWLPLTALTDDPERLPARVGAVQVALSGPGADRVAAPARQRIAVSVTQLGLTARLAAVALAAATDSLPVPTLRRLVFQDRLGGPYPLGELSTAGAGAAAPVLPWPAAVLDLVRPVTAAAISRYHLSARTAWGNVASGLAGAARMIAAEEPGLGGRAVDLIRRAFVTPELESAGVLDADGELRRRSCCLIYRLSPDPMLCRDCVLATASD